MKKTYILITTVIVGCLFLGIGFYAGWASKSFKNEIPTNSGGQTQCLSMYPLVKEYITDHYKYDPIEGIDLSHSTVGDIDIRYNSASNSCYASTTVYYTDYLDLGDGQKPNLTKSQYIFSIGDSIDITYRCDYSGNGSNDCRNEFQLKKNELKKSS